MAVTRAYSSRPAGDGHYARLQAALTEPLELPASWFLTYMFGFRSPILLGWI